MLKPGLENYWCLIMKKVNYEMIEKNKLIAYLNALEIKINSKTFESRLKAQKLSYILQEILNTQLCGDFNFYVKGPYSPALAYEYFNSSKDFEEGLTNYPVKEKEIYELNRVKQLIETLNPQQLEIIASLLYLKKEGLSEEKAEEKLHKLKPHLKEEDIWIGTQNLKKLLLTEEEKTKIMKSLKKEIEEWDEISNESLKRFD